MNAGQYDLLFVCVFLATVAPGPGRRHHVAKTGTSWVLRTLPDIPSTSTDTLRADLSPEDRQPALSKSKDNKQKENLRSSSEVRIRNAP